MKRFAVVLSVWAMGLALLGGVSPASASVANTAYASGYNFNGQVGDSTTTNRLSVRMMGVPLAALGEACVAS